MFEVCLLYDLLPGTNQETYVAWAKKTIATTLKQAGLVEFRAHRNMLGSPEVRATSVWRTAAAWIAFDEAGWKPLEQELRALATNIRVELWGPSPVVPEALHPGK
jgi:hypothetical protein